MASTHVYSSKVGILLFLSLICYATFANSQQIKSTFETAQIDSFIREIPILMRSDEAAAKKKNAVSLGAI